ncbi:hypothetical protein N7454_006954 [Penicillium verhagenii]|nr:hypothetical protein N7454_006954 [Penicillium verhagenii]
MLERAATGCFETAGRRFLRDSNGAIRTRRYLCNNFWKHNISGGDATQWFLALTQPLGQHLSTLPNPPHRSSSASEANSPFLDFLYPEKTQNFAALRASRLSRRPGLRRKKRTLTSLRRTYASEASSLQHHPQYEAKARSSLHQGVTHTTIEPTTATQAKPANSNVQQPSQDDHRIRDPPSHQNTTDGIISTERLTAQIEDILNSSEEYLSETTWELYIAAGCPPSVRSQLLAVLSQSERSIDAQRAWELFNLIPSDQCTHDHFYNIIHSQLRCESSDNLLTICELAVARGTGGFCFALAFSYYLKCRDWARTEHIWVLHSHFNAKRKRKSKIFPPPYHDSTLPEDTLALVTYLQSNASDRATQQSFRQIAQLLLTRISSSLGMLTSTSMDVLAPLMEISNGLKIMTLQHHVNIMESIQSSMRRLDFVRSIIFYQNMRAFLDRASKPRLPDQKLWERQLDLLVKFEMTDNIQFFLDEFAHFHKKPTLETYKQVLAYFGRVGNPSQVNLVFDRIVADYGKPKSRRLLTPLLNVYAALGDVPETLRQFRRLSEEFKLSPNTTCWNILLTAYANKSDSDGAFSKFSEMIQAKTHPDSHTFGIMMAICANKGDIEGVRELLREAEKQRVTITMAMIGTVSQAYIANGRFDLAEKLAIACLNLTIEGSPMRMWNTLLMHHAFRIDHHGFYRVCALMKKAGLEPDETTHVADLLRLALIGEADQARMTLRRLHRQGILQATELQYAIVILGYLKIRHYTMVKIIFREMMERFPDSGLESSVLNLQAQMPSDFWTKVFNIEHSPDASLRIKILEILLIDSISQRDISMLANTLDPSEARKESLTKTFDTWHFKYLVKEHGASGAISMANKLLQRELSSTGTASAQDSTAVSPSFRRINVMMEAHLKAEQYKEVDTCWQLVFSNAVREASRVNVVDVFKTSASIPASPSGPSAHTQRESIPADPPVKQKKHILRSRRFLLSRPLSLYMRSLAQQDKHERMNEIISQVEADGFELSTFNRSTLVQVLATSDSFAHISKAFSEFERYFMPNWPGWKRLIRGQQVKPSKVPRSLSLIEDRRAPAHSKNYLGKEASKFWRHVSPEYMQPTYITIVTLAAALGRVRVATIEEGGHELDQLIKTAPMTLKAITKMPWLHDKHQGVLIRQSEERPELDNKRLPVPFGSAPGGILGLDSRVERGTITYLDQVEDVEIIEWAGEFDLVVNQQWPKETTGKTNIVEPFLTQAAFTNTGWKNLLSPEDLLDLQIQDCHLRSQSAKGSEVSKEESQKASTRVRTHDKPLNLWAKTEP